MEITIAQLAELLGMASGGKSPSGKVNPFYRFMGKKVFIRTVTHHYTGQITELVGDESCILTTAAWIADSGRFFNALSSSKFEEVEPFPNPVQLSYGAVLDMTEIATLPTEQK